MIIGLTGQKNAGKDTAASWLVHEEEFIRIAFADKVKEAAAALFGITVEEAHEWRNDPDVEVALRRVSFHQSTHLRLPISWRHMLQRVGTEMGRGVFGDYFWINLALPEGTSPLEDIVVTDVRFNNEAERIHALYGKIIYIYRPQDDDDTHVSESGIRPDLIDATVNNTGDLPTFKERFMFEFRDLEQRDLRFHEL